MAKQKRQYKRWKCKSCGQPISYPAVAEKNYLVYEACSYGDSVKVEAKCLKCGFTNTAYRDGYHSVAARGKVRIERNPPSLTDLQKKHK